MLKKKNRSKKQTFDRPIIIGALCSDDAQVPKEIASKLPRNGKQIAYLPFKVEGKYLKNTITCMQLMDVMGLTVAGEHQKRISKHLPKVDKIAKHTGLVDTITRRGQKFLGLDAKGIAFSNWLKQNRPGRITDKTAVMIGDSPIMPSIKGALTSEGWKVRKIGGRIANRTLRTCSLLVLGTISSKQVKDISSSLKEAENIRLLVNLTTSKPRFRSKGIKTLTKHDFMKYFYHTCVKLLTHAL